MCFTKVRQIAIACVVAALSMGTGVHLYAMPAADEPPGAQAKTTPVPTAPALSDVDKALADLFTNSANGGIPGIDQARVKALLERAKGDDKTNALLKAQYDAALGETCARWVEFMNGRGTLNFLLDSLEHLLKAEHDLSDQKADYVAALEHHRKRIREIEKLNDQRFQRGRVALQDALGCRFQRLQAEISLERLRRDLAKPTTPVPAAPVDRAALDAQNDVDKALADVLTKSANVGIPEIDQARAKALLERAKSDGKMKTLLKAQYDAALGAACNSWLEFMAGRGTLNFLLDSLEHLLKAEHDLSDQKADYVAALEHHRKRIREIEKLNDQRFQQKRVAIQDALECRFYRLQAEISLERLRRDLSKPTTPVPAAPEDRAALDAQKDVDRVLADVLTKSDNAGIPEIDQARAKALLERANGDDKMKSLLKAQYDAALGETCGRWFEFVNGRGTLIFLLDSLEHLLKAEQDLSDQKADNVAALEHHWKRIREIEKVNDQRFRQGRVAIQDMLGCRFYRLQAEISLERARRDLPKPGR